MKILIISVLNGNISRGVETWAIQLLKNLLSQGIQSLMIQGGELLPSIELVKKSILVRTHPMRDLSGDTTVLTRVKRKLGLHETDIGVREFYKKIWSDVEEFDPDVVIPLSGELKVIRKLLDQSKIKAKLLAVGHAGIPKNVGCVDAFVALSERDLKVFKSKYSKIPLFIAQNGVDLELLSARNDVQGVIAKYDGYPRPVVLCVAALVPYKRIHLAIEALGEMKSGTLITIGSGPEIYNLNHLARKFECDSLRYIFLPKINYEDMSAYYALADVFIHTADEQEAFGSVIIEAMAMGKPVIVNNDPVRKSIVGDAGFTVNMTDTRELAKKILSISTAENKNANSKKILEQAQKFDWKNVSLIYANIFREITKG